jgi:hypothetical protein
MNWKFDDSEMPPFVVELTDESTDAECMVDEMTEAAIDRIVDESWPEGETLTEETIREMILWGMVYGWQFAQQTGGAEQTIANRMAAAKRREKANARHEEFRTAWESALAAGREVSIAQLAKEMGIPRATAYRAVHGRPTPDSRPAAP